MGPAEAAQKRAQVDGALTAQPRTLAVRPRATHRRRRCSHRPRARRRSGSAACPRRSPDPGSPRSRWASTSCCRPRCWRAWPAAAAPRWPPGGRRRRPFQAGRGYAMIASNSAPCSGSMGCSHTIIPASEGTCLRVPAAESGRGFGGSGLRSSIPASIRDVEQILDDGCQALRLGADVRGPLAALLLRDLVFAQELGRSRRCRSAVYAARARRARRTRSSAGRARACARCRA